MRSHGLEDFHVCREHNITDILCPIDDAGNYTADVGIDSLVGQNILTQGNSSVIQLLQQSNRLLSLHKLRHRYPYDWRSKTPVVLRATRQ